MQEKIEAYLKKTRGWANADTIALNTGLNHNTVIDGLRGLFRWKVIEKKYEFTDSYPKRGYIVFARIRKQKRN